MFLKENVNTLRKKNLEENENSKNEEEEKKKKENVSAQLWIDDTITAISNSSSSSIDQGEIIKLAKEHARAFETFL